MDYSWPTLSAASSEDTRKAETNIIWSLLPCMPDTNGYHLVFDLGWSAKWLNVASPWSDIPQNMEAGIQTWGSLERKCQMIVVSPFVSWPQKSNKVSSFAFYILGSHRGWPTFRGLKVRLYVLMKEKCQGSKILGLETWLWTFLENKVGHGDFFFLLFSFLYVSSLLSYSF